MVLMSGICFGRHGARQLRWPQSTVRPPGAKTEVPAGDEIREGGTESSRRITSASPYRLDHGEIFLEVEVHLFLLVDFQDGS